MEIKLSDHFNYRKLLKFTLPSIVMMLFTSIYGVVDGLFISNIEGETAFAGINLIYPYCMIFSAVGSLFGVGGSALVAYVRGEGKEEKANGIFSMLVYTMIGLSLLLTLIAHLFLKSAIIFFGASKEMFPYALRYGRIFLSTVPAFLLQFAFQSFLVTAEKPKLGLVFTLGAGFTNMFFDWLFIAVFRWGVEGAAIATCMGQCVGGLSPLIFFIFSKNCSLKLGKPIWNTNYLFRAASNGFANFITTIAINVVSMVYNTQLMKYEGEIGVSCYGIIMYVNLIFIGTYIGYSMGTAPLFSYNYGAQNYSELKNLYGRSIKIISLCSCVLSFLAIFFSKYIAGIFAGYNEAFLKESTIALQIYSLSYFFAGINIFSASLFAALNNGRISSVISGLRMFVFQLASVLILPIYFGVKGIWFAMPVSEFLVFFIAIIVMVKMKDTYKYV